MVGALADHHVPRQDLVDVIAAAAVTVVEAAGGYGKTSLTMELASHDPRTLVVSLPTGSTPDDLVAGVARAARLRSLAQGRELLIGHGPDIHPLDALVELLAVEPTGTTLVIDDVEHATVGAGRLLADLARAALAPHRLVLVGRALPEGCGDLDRIPHLRRLSSDELRMTPDQAAALLCDGYGLQLHDEAVAAVHRATGGWPAGLVMWASRVRAGGEPGSAGVGIDGDELLSMLAERLRAPLDERDRWAAAQLAHLPSFAADLAADLADPGLLRRLIDAGIAFTTVGPDQMRMAGPVAEQVGRWAALDPQVASRAADRYAAAGQIPSGVRLLADSGAFDHAAALLLSVGDGLDPAELVTLLRALPDDARDRHPHLLVHEARALVELVRWTQWAGVLDRLDAHPERHRDPTLRCAADAERALYLLSVESRYGDAERLAGDVLGHEQIDVATRLRALEVLGWVCAASNGADSFQRAGELFERAITLSLEARATRWWFRLTRLRAKVALFPLGRADELLASYDALLPLTPAESQLRAKLQLFRAEALLDLGRYAETGEALAEVDRIAGRTDDGYLLGMVSWMRAVESSQQGRVEEMLHHQAEAEGRIPDADRRQVAMLYRDCVERSLRVGQLDVARRYLRRLEPFTQFEGEVRAYVAQAFALYCAIAGDPTAAIAELDALQRQHPLPRDEWRRHLYRAATLQRLGDARAGSEAATAFDLAARLGGAHLVTIREAALARTLAPLAAAAGSASAAAICQPRSGVAIRCLGGFAVDVDGVDTPVVGYSRDLLQALVTAGGEASVDALIEHLWPGSTVERGRRGLRNALHRLPARDRLVERSGDRLALAPAVTVDALDFEREARDARSALRAGGPGSLDRAMATLDTYGPFLPDARIDVVERTARRLDDLAAALCDDAARAAHGLGRSDEAVALLRRAIAIEPASEDRRFRLAHLLHSTGRSLEARMVVDEIDRLATELGVRPGAEIESLRGQLHTALAS